MFQAFRMDVGTIRWCDETDTVDVKEMYKGKGVYDTGGEESS